MQPTSAQAQNQPPMVAPGGATNYHTQGMQPTSELQPFGHHTLQGEKEFVDGPGAEIRNGMLGVNKPPLTTNPKRGRARGPVKYTNSQPPRSGSNQGTPPSRPPLGQGSRTTSDEQSQASTPVGYNSEGFARNSMISTSSAASIPSVATTPIGIVTAKFDQVRVNQTPPNDTTAQQPAVYTAPPPPQEQSQTLSESLTSGDSITESSLNSSTYSEPRLDDELPPTMNSPKTKSRLFMFHVAP